MKQLCGCLTQNAAQISRHALANAAQISRHALASGSVGNCNNRTLARGG